MAQNKFKAFVKGRRWSDNLRKFVAHAEDDPNLPDVESWEELEDYMSDAARKLGWNVEADTLKAARHVWYLYLEER